MTKTRCDWCTSDPIYIAYHDKEWGKPIYDDRLLFEFLILEGMQAGLSWLTILKKREHMRKVFDNFEAKEIIKYNDKKIAALLNDPGIIRNRLKISALIQNAHAYLQIQKTHGSFSDYIWQFVNHKHIVNKPKTMKNLPTKTEISDLMSKTLKNDGFNFVGSTICYAFMQAVGMVDDHLQSCFRFKK